MACANAGQAADGADRAVLVGDRTIELRSATDSIDARRVAGHVSLLANHSTDQQYTHTGRPTNVGSYDIDLRRLGLPGLGDAPPVIVASLIGSDSVLCDVVSARPGFELWLRGRLRG